MIDLTLHCPVCGLRADLCFDHGDEWKKRPPTSVHQKTEAQLRASVNEFTQDDPPPYGREDNAEVRRSAFDHSDCGNGPDEEGNWPCEPKVLFGTQLAECQTCGRVAAWGKAATRASHSQSVPRP